MIAPTEEELAKLRATYGDAMRLTPPIKAGLETARIVMRLFDQESFDRYYDDLFANPETSGQNAFLRHLLWPTRETCARLTMASAGLPALVMSALELTAKGGGQNGPAATFEPLGPATSDAVLSAAGLDRATAESLLAQAGAGGIALELVTLKKGGGLVLRAPEPVLYESILASVRNKKGAASAARGASIASTAWCSEGDPAALFRRLPALAATVVMPALLRLGGAGAEHSFCFDD